jgi:hypothetical protein
MRKLKIWCLLRDQYAHVKPVEEAMRDRAEFLYDAGWDPQAMLDQRPELVLCVNDFHYEVADCLAAARDAHIPSLVLQDGILEWRCQYENPLFGEGGAAPQHQPVMADKIACIGRQSALHIGAWGNTGKAEVTGMPRLDALLERPRRAPRSPAGRLLVMTAKKPGFTPGQTAITLRSLIDLKSHLDSVDGLQVVWRTRPEVAAALGVENRLGEFSTLDLCDVLDRVDAVVTTPSTAMLEAMLLERPVAVLDYHNVPRFAHSAWSITAPGQIPGVIAELLQPSVRKMLFQRTCLEDSLLEGPAAGRVAALIDRMVERVPGVPSEPTALSASQPSLGELYPRQEVFACNEVAELQARLARSRRRIQELERERQTRSFRNGIFALGRGLWGRFKRAA